MAAKFGLGGALRASTALIAAHRLLRAAPILVPASLLAFGAGGAPALAQPVWSGPGTDFNTGTNWSTGTVPTSAQTPIFQNTGPTSLSTSVDTQLAGITFNAGAASHNLTLGNNMTLFGSVVNNSANEQTINVASGWTLFFLGAAASGQGVNYIGDGALVFDGDSTGGNSAFTVGSQMGIRGNARTVVLGSLTGASGTLVRNITANDITIQVGSLGTSTTFGGVFESVEGAEALTLDKVGTGTLTLTGDNTLAGTTITAGTLAIGNGGTLGVGAVTNNAALVFDRTDVSTFANDISGSGTVTQAGSGTTILTGNNTYTGVTTISAGTLQIGNGSTTGTLGTGAVVNNASLVFNRDSLNVTNAISGSGSVTIAGSTSLSGGNSYLGGTIINSFLFVAADSALGASSGGLTFNNGFLDTTASFTSSRAITLNAGGGTFEPSAGTTLTLTGLISGAGGLGMNGPGTLVLSSGNTYLGDTVLNGGTVVISADSAFGNAAGQLYVNGGTLQTTTSFTMARNIELQAGGSTFAPDADTVLTLSGVVTGSNLTMNGAGTLVLAGANTYSGTTTISAGTLRVGDGGLTGSLGTGAVVNNAALVFDRSGALVVSGGISGTGTLGQTGAGTTILTGANTYSGTTTIDANGTLQIGSGSTAGSLGTGGVTNNGTLAFNRSDDITVGNAITGAGRLVKGGAGVLTLNGTNTYADGTVIGNGTVAMGNIGAIGTGTVTLSDGALRSNVTGSLANAIGVAANTTGTVSAAAAQTLTLTGALTVAAGGALVFGSAAETGIVAAGFNSAALTSTGSLRVAGGTLRVDSNAFGALLSDFSSTTIDSGATLNLNGRSGGSGTIANLQGSGTLTNTAEITVLAGSFAGAITGSADLFKTSGGTLVLSGTNTYSGLTTIGNGTLRVGAGGTTGTLGSGNVVVGNTLAFNRSDAALVAANAISGAGRVRQIGSGTTTLTGALSYTGGTFVDAGTLILGDTTHSVTLPGNATIAAGGMLSLQNGSLGSGTITNGGSLAIGLNATAGSATINSDAAPLTSVVFSGNATAGTAQINNRANLEFTGSATAANSTITNDCCLRFSGSATAGSATIVNAAAGNIDFDDTATAGSASISNAGFVRFLTSATGGTAAYTGQAGSTMDFSFRTGAGTTLGSLAGTGAVDLGSITLAVGGNNTSTTFAGVIADGGLLGGSGAGLTKVGTGTLTLTGTNTYTGLTTVSAGTLRVGNGGTTGTLGTGGVVNNAALAFDRSDVVTLSHAVSGTGSLIQAGTGNLIVDNTQAYTGATFVNAGRLSVNGSIASSSGVTVASGGTLGGNGHLPGVVVQAGGTIAPGNSIGTLNIDGNLTLASGSTTQIEVQGPLIDRLNVTGAATLGGTLHLLAQAGPYIFNAPYTIIQAGAVAGNFAAVNATGSFGAGVTSNVSTTATQAQLTLTPAPLVPIITPPVEPPTVVPVVTPPIVPPPVVKSAPVLGPQGTSNQVSVAAAFDRAVAGGADVAAFFPLYNLSAAALPRGLDQVSGQIHAVASGMHAQAAYQFLGAILDPGRGGKGLGDTTDGIPRRYAVWASGFGGGGRMGASGNSGTYAATSGGGGVAVGTDVRLTAQVVAGVALAGSGGMVRLSDSMGRAEASQIQGAVYGTGTFGALRLSAAVAYGGMDVTTRRTVPFLGVGDIRGRYTSLGVSTRLEAGWRLEGIVPRVALTPSVAFQGSWYETPGFKETGVGGQAAAALAVSGRNQGQSRMELSVRADMALTPGLSGFGRLGWAAYLQRDAGMSAGFIGLANSGFSLSGARPDAHAALISGGVDWQLNPGMTVTARVDAELASNSYAANGTVRIRYEF
ncbi:autotransporter-associated beta strand repeat-containing protein [Roseococcus pinisoli]|uniref:Autotransporter-associated beta strand repeat-containing protein n=1 Tax=Roseococcus pinisoli TaxID=2835040 RepID=A0ABS5QBY5_9PROT|nr:autotransporter-associated beta strand repeat-containing protein [Roseococcus pinisoli]MBS7811018.1 autotransporter-associated beta strand repeat-containing protein [Roseococcus pinisoli]